MVFGLANVDAASTKTALAGLTLNVAGTALAVSDATAGSTEIFWEGYDPSPDWTDGQRVPVKLTAAVSKPAKPTGLTATAGNAQVSLSWWTNANDATITKYQVQRGTGNTWGSWADIPDSAPGEANATSYTVTA